MTIPLSRGYNALVDDEDYEFLTQWKWSVLTPNRETLYVMRSDYRGNRRIGVYMHRLITNAPKSMEVDHINHDGLDNRRCNLRVCTRQENSRNQRRKRSSPCRYKGVFRERDGWGASITPDHRLVRLGKFATPEDAALAYNEAALECFGKFACLNVIDTDRVP